MGRAKRVRKAKMARRRSVRAAAGWAEVVNSQESRIRDALLLGEEVDIHAARALDSGSVGEWMTEAVPEFGRVFRRFRGGWITASAMVRRRKRRTMRVERGLIRTVNRSFARAEALVARRKFYRAQREKRRERRWWSTPLISGMMGVVFYMQKKLGAHWEDSHTQELQAIRARAEQRA